MPGMTANAPAVAKLVGENDVLPMVAPAGGLQSGDVVSVAGHAGVVLSPVAEGELVGVDITRTFLFPNPDLAATPGLKYAWDGTNKKIVATTTGDFELGTCVPTNDNAAAAADYGVGTGAAIALRLK